MMSESEKSGLPAPPRVSVVIVTYHSEKEIATCLDSVLAQSIGVEIFVIDNASADSTPEIVQQYARNEPRIKTILSEQNLGLAAGNNCVLGMASGDYILFLNPDTILRTGALESMVAFMDGHADFGVVGPLNLYSDGAPHLSFFDHWGQLQIFIWRVLPYQLPRRLFDHFTNYRFREPAFVSGACLMMRRKLFEAIGGYDPEFFLAIEDVADLCLRARRAGGRVAFLPEATVVHLGNRSGQHASFVVLWQGNRGSIYYCWKHKGLASALLCSAMLAANAALRCVVGALLSPFRRRFTAATARQGQLLVAILRRNPIAAGNRVAAAAEVPHSAAVAQGRISPRSPATPHDPPGRAEKPVCGLCGARGAQRLWSACDPHYAIPGTYHLCACPNCRVWYLDRPPGVAELLSLYPNDSYYAYLAPPPPEPAWRRLVRRMLGFRVERLDSIGPGPGRLLDVGCGTGAYLRAKRGTPWQCWGVEPNAAAAAMANATGLSVLAGTLIEAGFPANYFDVVRANHSFEHVPDPHVTLEEVFRITKPGGLVLFGLPNAASLAARIYRSDWWHVSPPLHIFHYSPGNIRHLFVQHGLRVEAVRFRSDYAGLLGSLQIRRNRLRGRCSDRGGLWQNSLLRILAQWAALLTDAVRCGDCMEVVARKPMREGSNADSG